MGVRFSIKPLIASLLIAVPLMAAELPDLASLTNAVLAHNSGLKAAQAQMDSANAGLREAKSQRLPMLSARSQWTRGDNPVYVFGSLLEQGRFGADNFAVDSLNHPADLSNIKSGLDLGFPLFTGYELTTASRLGELGVQEAATSREGTLQRLRYQTAGLYLEMLLDQDILKTLDERIAASAQEVADAQKLREKGLVLGSDYYAAEAILSGLRSWKVQAQTDQASASSRLVVMIAANSLSVQGALTDPSYKILSRDDLIHQAVDRRPDLQAAATELSMAEVKRRQAGRSLFPRVNAFASLETDTNDFSSNPTNHLFGVSARLPFGDPGYFSRRNRAASGEEAARQTRADLEENIRAEVSQAYETYQGALAARTTAKETVERAARSLELFRPLYRSGRQSIIEVLRAEEALAKAQAAYSEALFRIHSTYLQLMAASGGLDDQAIGDMSRQLSSPSPHAN